MRSGLSRFTRPARPRPSQRATCSSAARAVASPARASRSTASIADGRRRADRPALHEQGVLADLRLPAAGRAAVARGTVGVDGHVAHLAAIASRAGHRPAVDDQSAADAHLARDEDDVRAAARAAAARLGQCAEICLVGDRQGTKAPSAWRSACPSATSCQPRFGATDTRPSE